ncbi:Cys-tRNA(Pro) deacylase [Miniphocaeibacter massiliensis]|uniref:Cys-tRNA(Pro) deacylase n=1 Tax=Miniphocaeibacter massiliensis TaxID=2041841 RepID=UPI000C1C7AD6|nr:Cys-tRNA(Pro) deacylase [Miniphocaeibacter massiliensis]
MKKVKTNAMRILDSNNIEYELNTYDVDENIDGKSVAKKLNEIEDKVFKTLVTIGQDKNYYIFVIPVTKELDLKNAAKAVGVKKLEMIHVKDLKNITGYIRGGCSPIGMKKLFKTVIDESSKLYEKIYVSGGKLGTQIKISPKDLKEVVKADIYSLTK